MPSRSVPFMETPIILEPSKGVPDQLSEVLQSQPATEDEKNAGRILRLHRDFLNGGIEQAISNLAAIDEVASTYCAAYQAIGLDEAFLIWKKAISLAAASQISGEQWDALDDEYDRLIYGNGANDAIEWTIVRYIQCNPKLFEQALIKSNNH
jgi:hypothetical protein